MPDIYQTLLDDMPDFDLETSPDVLERFIDMLDCGLPYMDLTDTSRAVMTIGAIRAYLAGGVDAETPTLLQLMLDLAKTNQ